MNWNIDILKENINQLMLENGVKQKELADIIGSNQSSVSAILSGKNSRCFTAEQIGKIAIHFGVSLDQLYGITQDGKPKELSQREVGQMLIDILMSKYQFQFKSITVKEENLVFLQSNADRDSLPAGSYFDTTFGGYRCLQDVEHTAVYFGGQIDKLLSFMDKASTMFDPGSPEYQQFIEALLNTLSDDTDTQQEQN